MKAHWTSSAAGRLTVVALLIAGIGFAVQMAAGVTRTPTIPPGLVVILGAAVVAAFVPIRWAPVAGPIAGLFNFVALFTVRGGDLADEIANRLVDATPVSALIGAWIMVVGLIVATVAGAIGAVHNRRVSTVSSG